MKKLLFLFILICLVLGAGQAMAVSVGIEPPSSMVLIDDTVDVELMIYGLGDHVSQSLGSYFLEISYDDSILDLLDVQFNSLLGASSMSITDWFEDPGMVTVAETSLLSIDDLNDLQPSSFSLATLTFRGIALGTSGLQYSWVDLSDETGFSVIDPENVFGASVTVKPVPEPSTMLLLGIGIGGLALLRRRQKK